MGKTQSFDPFSPEVPGFFQVAYDNVITIFVFFVFILLVNISYLSQNI